MGPPLFGAAVGVAAPTRKARKPESQKAAKSRFLPAGGENPPNATPRSFPDIRTQRRVGLPKPSCYNQQLRGGGIGKLAAPNFEGPCIPSGCGTRAGSTPSEMSAGSSPAPATTPQLAPTHPSANFPTYPNLGPMDAPSDNRLPLYRQRLFPPIATLRTVRTQRVGLGCRSRRHAPHASALD